jgi:hypothetical protein
MRTPDNRPYTQFVFWIVAIGAFIIATAQAGIVFWRLVDMVRGWI